MPASTFASFAKAAHTGRMRETPAISKSRRLGGSARQARSLEGKFALVSEVQMVIEILRGEFHIVLEMLRSEMQIVIEILRSKVTRRYEA